MSVRAVRAPCRCAAPPVLPPRAYAFLAAAFLGAAFLAAGLALGAAFFAALGLAVGLALVAVFLTCWGRVERVGDGQGHARSRRLGVLALHGLQHACTRMQQAQ